MVVGLGAGSTALIAVQRIASLLASGKLADILGVPCSRAVGAAATRLGISLTTLEDHPVIDLTIDGADEVDPKLALIKGAGGALLHEKIVAQASRREIIVVDDDEAITDARHAPHAARRGRAVWLAFAGGSTSSRSARGCGSDRGPSGMPFRTDQDNLILDCAFGPIRQPRTLARMLSERAGIVEHGLFIDLATDLVIAGDDGIRHVTRAAEAPPATEGERR